MRAFRHLAVAAVVGTVMTGALWLFLEPTSPLVHPGIAQPLVILSFPAVIVGMVFRTTHGPSEIALYLSTFVQWALLGFCASWLVGRLGSSVRKTRSTDA